MRNLKRALSLALAAIMLIGMMVVSASAASYNDLTDKDQIVNKDAVSMLVTLGVIEGKPDGSYAPTEGVDRAQMAKMISVIMNQGVDNGALYENSPSGLTDISSHWAKGHINYCYTTGIIAGRGNGKFDPDAGVTGSEAAKMLLVAAGYDPAIEGLTGTDWEINTNALASKLGIFRNFKGSVAEPLSRDNAALLIYNALDVEMIESYTNNGYAMAYSDARTILSSMYGVYKVEGVVVGNKWAELDKTDSDSALKDGKTVLDNVVLYSSTTSNTTKDEGVAQSGKIAFNVDTPVDFLGKTVTMYIEKTTILSDSKVLGVSTKDDVNVINATAATQSTVKDYLKGTGVAVTKGTEFYVNYGYCKTEEDAHNLINDYSYAANNSDKFNLNGVDVEIIDNNNDGDAEYVLFTRETLSEVRTYSEKNETISFYAPGYDKNNELANKTVTETEDFEDVVFNDEVTTDDLILYVQYGGRTYISAPEVVTGKMTRVDRDKADELFITVDGEEYRQSYILDAASLVDVDLTRFDIADAKNEPGFDNSYDFVLDSNGYVIAIRPAEEVVTNYALVVDSAWTLNALDRSGQVKILMTDGTVKTYSINWKNSAKAMEDINTVETTNDVKGKPNDEKLETYLGTRDVNKPGQPGQPGQTYNKTGVAAGSIITYTLSDDDVLTIKHVLQGNTLKGNDSEIDSSVNTSSTAGVADNGTVIRMNTSVDQSLQYTAPNGYTGGRGSITVKAGAEDAKTYAVDKNTVAFYYWTNAKGETEYGVATGWDHMSDVANNTEVQVYPTLDKTSYKTYEATDLADVILFEAEAKATSANYMLVLSANAIGKDLLELNVVFEDGTVQAIEVDDDGGHDWDDEASYMKAYTYAENADGTYDIGDDVENAGTAKLLKNGTVDSSLKGYIALSGKANV
ncbi:S-layer homology domain-containing protein [Flavonifractor plautii]|uniref:S-layer homology domain-containing protein n=2 Tax=Flavonifractor plautii TaxID=292800 RepID=UPI001896BCAC|nr:S-layer homology domain-containing protein [Flavonifractor plautii]MDB7903013.1 S-layer homology domain-containing protein [Flavonifractor plautii]MDB7921032.1 S-layer homology domain-containing protein [Flavonifractor plautii]MDB7944845.1 S-layer homology domain-containing protein [Flavonifractor plautii]MDS9668097.1 S-layer homology domain-containing protein [Flavonifractor plautii]